jgi:hypothetical protein
MGSLLPTLSDLQSFELCRRNTLAIAFGSEVRWLLIKRFDSLQRGSLGLARQIRQCASARVSTRGVSTAKSIFSMSCAPGRHVAVQTVAVAPSWINETRGVLPLDSRWRSAKEALGVARLRVGKGSLTLAGWVGAAMCSVFQHGHTRPLAIGQCLTWARNFIEPFSCLVRSMPSHDLAIQLQYLRFQCSQLAPRGATHARATELRIKRLSRSSAARCHKSRCN